MKNIKIKEFKAKGLRGFKNEIVLPLEEKTIVLYGDNGTGKSSIADIIEWFYTNRVNHLSDIEIGRNGIDAMRHTSLSEVEEGNFEIKFKHSAFDCQKNLYLKKDSFVSDISNDNQKFRAYLAESSKEKLLIRYKELSNFVVATQGERLTQLSEIIGFSEVTETKKLFNKVYNKLDREIKSSGSEKIIQNNQQVLITNLNQNIVNEQQFVTAINDLVIEYKYKDIVTSLDDIPKLINKFKKPADQKRLAILTLLEQLINVLISFEASFGQINQDFEKFALKYNDLVEDTIAINNLKLTDLLSAGETVLSIDTEDIFSCPLCESDARGRNLLEKVQKRLNALTEIKKKKTTLEGGIKNLIQRSSDERQNLKVPLTNAILKEADFSEIKQGCINIGLDLKALTDQIEAANFTNKIIAAIPYKAQNSYIQLQLDIKAKMKGIKDLLPKDSDTELIVKLQASLNAYNEIEKQKSTLKKIEQQKNTFEILCNAFSKKQKEALDLFFKLFSSNINEYYVYMNPDESVENIKLMPIESEDEIKGLTIQYEFFNNSVSPPHKYLSESHLNCLGISFFLASVIAFNKVNSFFVLDDVISSFDSNHRKRFLDLLAEKFSSYQILLLTHEHHFFEYARTVAKAKGWLVDTFKYSKEQGTYIAEPKKTILERINKKFADGDDEKLGSDIRIFLEHLLKDIANNVDAKVSFRFNDRNEERMTPELLNEIKVRLSKSSKGDNGLLKKSDALITRTLSSNFIGNKDSHDNEYVMSLGDCKGFWKDVKDIEALFKCGDCDRFISVNYYAEDSKEVKCRCGSLKYEWQK
ncbi:hypothetical protein ABDJ41_19140 [Pedobacter sp. ASV1-7]|uniref:hypothetical protein n=1 Tax=Pedobacter sp. ASV1-7 TaxID=3145237 RepID=UPI0032E900D9